MELLLSFIKDYAAQLSLFGAAVAFVFSSYKFMAERKASHFWREFDTYHKLIKELVEPSSENGAMYVDRQTAAIYELRFYKRYYPHSLRMLKGLKIKWEAVPDQFKRLIEELDLTIEFINESL